MLVWLIHITECLSAVQSSDGQCSCGYQTSYCQTRIFPAPRRTQVSKLWSVPYIIQYLLNLTKSQNTKSSPHSSLLFVESIIEVIRYLNEIMLSFLSVGNITTSYLFYHRYITLCLTADPGILDTNQWITTNFDIFWIC